MRIRKLLALGWIVLVGVPLVLTACGGPGGGPGGGVTPPSEDDYVLTIADELHEASFDSDSNFWVRTVTDINADLIATLDWLQPPFPVSPDGSFEVVIDAREVGGSGVSPERFGDWYLYPRGSETSTVTASDPAARLKAVSAVSLFQSDAGEGNTRIHASDLLHLHELMIDGSRVRYSGRLVFSDRPVTIQGRVGPAGAAPRLELDMQLRTGWNLVHYRPATSGQVGTYVANPIDPDLTIISTRTRSLARMASDQDAAQVAGYSMFPLHQTGSAASASSFIGRLTSQQPTDLFAPTWLKSGGPASLLVPLEQALPGTRGGGTMTLSEPGARGLLADVRYYDSASITPFWWEDHASSNGVLDMLATDRTTVVALYVDRATELDMDGFEISRDGRTLTFEADGVDLDFGWNLLRADFDEATSETRLESYAEADGPWWEVSTPQ